MSQSLRLGVVAGEASGDQLGAHLIAALKARGRARECAGIGGPRMVSQGFVSHYPMERLSVRGYTEAVPALTAGTAFGQDASGYAPATDPDFALRDAFVLVDAAGNNRHPPTGDGNLATAEVRQLLLSGLDVANRARAQIRRPTGSSMRATVSVVGLDDDELFDLAARSVDRCGARLRRLGQHRRSLDDIFADEAEGGTA